MRIQSINDAIGVGREIGLTPHEVDAAMRHPFHLEWPCRWCEILKRLRVEAGEEE